jgi:hypothetical protein
VVDVREDADVSDVLGIGLESDELRGGNRRHVGGRDSGGILQELEYLSMVVSRYLAPVVLSRTPFLQTRMSRYGYGRKIRPVADVYKMSKYDALFCPARNNLFKTRTYRPNNTSLLTHEPCPHKLEGRVILTETQYILST